MSTKITLPIAILVLMAALAATRFMYAPNSCTRDQLISLAPLEERLVLVTGTLSIMVPIDIA